MLRNVILTIVVWFFLIALDAAGCTSLLVTAGASTDGSTMITYTCDGEFHPHLEYLPAADYAAGDSLEIVDWHGKKKGKIIQVPHTHAVVGMMNEHQLAISETTFDGRPELENKEGMLHYFDLIILALQRAKTARDAINVMTALCNEYGYGATGESFSIADTKEVWIMELIGMGPGRKGAVWVALRVPDGYIAAHANKARIGEFPLDDPKNCLYSGNVISFAVEMGYYNPESGKPFRFCDIYCPPTPKNQRYAETRVWSLFRRAAPSLNLPPDYHRGLPGAQPYPLWVKPDHKISVEDVMSLMRDHYEGTAYDMTQGIDAGPYNSPYRWRPMNWVVDSVEYAWERPISTQQTAFSFISQSRAYLPDDVGGLLWYGVDDTYTTCYFPLYCSISEIPHSYSVGELSRFSWESAWWVFNFVANFANLKYSFMIKDVQAVQSEIEAAFLQLQPVVEKSALHLIESDRALAIRYLTDYSVSGGERVTARWRDLAEELIRKYNDGYMQDSTGRPGEVGYPEEWLRNVLKQRSEQFRLPTKAPDAVESRLID